MQNARSISELNRLIQQALETELDPVIWVIGEIADFRSAPQGHAYFELVEKQGNTVQAKIRANSWAFAYRSIAAKFEAATGSRLKNGMKVLAQVSVNFHAVYGLSINVKDIDPSFSLGERARVRQETIDRLTQEGILRLNARHILPPVIQKIAVISSPTAAGYGDFINQLKSNSYGYHIYHKLYPSTMQGNEAVNSILKSMDQLESDSEKLQLEAVVIIRGGGAQLDLDCFDEYRLAAKIANCPIPVLTGIGHERDETVSDLVAHTRLKTPTAVAEFLLSGFREFEENLGIALQRLDRTTRQQLSNETGKMQQLAHQVKALSESRIKLEKEKVNSVVTRIKITTKGILASQANQLTGAERNIRRGADSFLRSKTEELKSKELILKQLNPANILARGYTRTEVRGTPVNLANPKLGDMLKTHSSNQTISSTITQIEEK
ncbi:exodeoxyribonuclease VII large subunit [Algoriphagus halophytocola]|uniref:Exodeoxyribonuclease 7 large subunit n=1 Tax=Algoriphagus halophytocola TaxID=2991499 RepID=A0ABY6MHV8_9BACT|nr:MULTISPECIES: exodeoxyribonuclease VII large subunit [unclassified Algoriphagus]UZD22615.1 exodeoxyribonuclease VII large subunit [Algoriphagus sp. TR-M5]WBL43881.1 exodeoxyribonuclease VII large subunit [Algoriphagus sp. TR-M9]